MKLADYCIALLADRGIDSAFVVTGGMAMHLNNALAAQQRIRTICCHHEQGCSLAAEGYAHVTGRPALVQVTAGPGVINALNGVFGAYVDGLPMVVVSGQAKRETLCSTYGLTGRLRQAGEQEADTIGLASRVTKYAVQVRDPLRIRYEVEKALHIACSGRPGPVWIEIPLDVQAAEINPAGLKAFPVARTPEPDLAPIARKLLAALRAAKRPLLVAGPGLNAAHSRAEFVQLAESLHCPVLCAGVLDVIQRDHPLYAGGMGNVGTRAGNINVQNADLLLFTGVTMHLTFTTYNWKAMGRNARKIVVECDSTECERPQYIADETIRCGTAPFLKAMLAACAAEPVHVPEPWLAHCRKVVRELPAVPERLHTVTPEGRINPYWFAEELFARLEGPVIVVPGNASSGVTAQQAGHLRPGQRLIANFGNGPMGMAVPAAVGAAMAAPKSRIICLDGDGSFMLNMQELATIAYHHLNILIFIYNNGGYMSIRQTQEKFFGRRFGCGPESGIGFPEFTALGRAFGLESLRLEGPDWRVRLDEIARRSGPLLVEVMLDPAQGFEPKISSRRLPDGRIVSLPPEDMFPFLPREELQKYLLFPLSEEGG